MFSSSSHPRSHRVLWKNRPFLVFQATFFQSSRLPFCAWLSRCWSTQGCTRMPLKQSLKMATNRHRVKYSPFNILRIQTLRQPDLLDFVAWAGTVNFDSHYVCGLLKQCARSFHVHVFIMDFFVDHTFLSLNLEKCLHSVYLDVPGKGQQRSKVWWQAWRRRHLSDTMAFLLETNMTLTSFLGRRNSSFKPLLFRCKLLVSERIDTLSIIRAPHSSTSRWAPGHG